MRQPDPNSNAYSDGNGHIHANTNADSRTNRYAHFNSNVDAHTYIYTKAQSITEVSPDSGSTPVAIVDQQETHSFPTVRGRVIPFRRRIADSSSKNAVSISSARTMKRFPSSRYASTIQSVRPLQSNALRLIYRAAPGGHSSV